MIRTQKFQAISKHSADLNIMYMFQSFMGSEHSDLEHL